MFRDVLIEELAMIFGETVTETYDASINTNESIYINYGDMDVSVNDEARIVFLVPFSLTVYSDRNDFCFGYLTTKYAMYNPNIGERKITPVDGIESPAWHGAQVLSSTKQFMFEYSTDYNRQIEQIKQVEFKQ